MSISLERLSQAVEALVRLGARRVILFGSAASDPASARDVDLAIEGIPPERLLDADVAMMDVLKQPFDLVSRELSPRFYSVVSRYGRVLYG